MGAFSIGSFFVDWLKAPILHNARDSLPLRSRYGEGSYAVVTGATGSTGEAFCDKLASQGFKLILVDDGAKSSELAELSAKHGSAPTFTFDFCN